MSAESKCNCQHCNGHIAFPTEMAGQFISCPHCQLETRLFIPSVAIAPEKSASTGKNKKAIVLLAVIIVFIVGIAAALFLKNSQKQTAQNSASNLTKQATSVTAKPALNLPEQSDLKPVNGAFGWKLGDKLSEQLQSQVKDANYYFKPDTEMQPFVESNNCSFFLSLTKSGQIAQISVVALNITEDNLYEDKRSLVSLLTDKYGLRLHDPNETGNDAYYFGTDDREAHLAIQSVSTSQGEEYIFKLDFYDRQLYEIVCDEYNARIKKEDADKTAPLSKQLQ